MKKILFIIGLFVSCMSYGQVPGLTGNTPVNRGIGVWDVTGDSLLHQQSDKRWTMAHKYDVYGVNARGNHWYGSLAGSSATASTEGLIALGHNAARLINTGGYGIYMGWQAGYNLPSASYGNIFIGGYRPGFNQTAGSRSLILGYLRDLQSLTADNQMDIMGIFIGKDVGETTGQTVSGGNVGIGLANPTARLHLPAGAATAEKAPLKFTSGTHLGTPENGAVEYNGTHLYITIGGVRYQLDQQVVAEPNSYINIVTGPTNFYQLGRQRNDSIMDLKALQISYGGGPITPITTDTTVHFPLDSATTAGTYIPTITGTANLAASTSGVFHWTKSGDWYEVSGEISLDPTTTATLTVVRLSLPVSSSIPVTYNITGFVSDDLGTVGRIRGDVANSEAEIRFTPVDITNRVFTVRFRFPYIAP